VWLTWIFPFCPREDNFQYRLSQMFERQYWMHDEAVKWMSCLLNLWYVCLQSSCWLLTICYYEFCGFCQPHQNWGSDVQPWTTTDWANLLKWSWLWLVIRRWPVSISGAQDKCQSTKLGHDHILPDPSQFILLNIAPLNSI
jgi:hypothetical protein